MSQDDPVFFPAPEDESQETTPLEEMIMQIDSRQLPFGQLPDRQMPEGQLEDEMTPRQEVQQEDDQQEDDQQEDDKDEDAFRTTGEVADMLNVPAHVLRFWGARFGEIRPVKGQGGRRYYREEDVEFLRGLRRLLYEEGYTIKGVHRIVRKKGLEFVRGKGESSTQNHDDPLDQILHGLVADLEQIKERLHKLAA